jgi:uncharacterized protein YndB with AHSA1/START domain
MTETGGKPGSAAGVRTPHPQGAGRGFVVTRVFDAPRARVFQAWTETERLKQWWGPKGFAMLSCRNDLRPGGVFHYGMRTPNGETMWGKWTYREVVVPERLVFVVAFSDEVGGETRNPWSPDWPLQVLSTLTFVEEGGRTPVTMTGVPLNATESERDTFEAGFGSMQQGWAGTLDQLARYLATG